MTVRELAPSLLTSELAGCKNGILSVLTGGPPPAYTPSEEGKALHALLLATTERKESNSCLLIGAVGSGKSLLLESALAGSSAHYLVRLDARIQTSDRAALREMAAQLVSQRAFAAPLPPDSDSEGEEAEDGGEGMLASLAATMANVLSLLESQGTRPLVVVLDAFDLFTQRARQALLYCLLDAVQAGSYAGGLALIGMTSRVDTTDLLEKRVKSRFSHRIIHLRPPDSLESFTAIARQAHMPPLKAHPDFAAAWNQDIDALFNNPAFAAALRSLYELSNDVRALYRYLHPAVAALTPEEPVLAPPPIQNDAMQLNDLTDAEFALLIAAKHLHARDRTVFNFEMAFDQLRRFNRSADRRVAFMCFNTLLALELFLPDAAVASLAIGRQIGGVRKEYVKVRCVLDPPVIVRAAKDRARSEPLSTALVKWAQSHG